ncbi:unnamed protein product, partial [Cuscuta campestris]
MEGTSRTLPYTIRFVGLLGSHSLGRNPKFMATAVDLGRELIRRKIKLAYGGGSVGLQGAVASTVFTNGGLVRGFIPGYIATRRVYGPTYGVEHTVSSNYYKYFEMNHAVEAFIILPGGVDTMEGLFTLISWASEGLHNRPIGLLNVEGIGEGQSTSRPPLFDGTNYTYWKERVRIYIRSTNFQLWLVIKNGEEIPMKKVGEKLVPKTEDEFDAEDIKKVENYAKAINMLYCAVNPDDYRKISCCTTAKEMWDKLEVTYEDAIYESIGVSNVTIDGLRGNLKTYESTILTPSLDEQKKKGIALKATKETMEEDSSDDDNEFGLVIKKFHKFMKKEFERKGRKHDGPPKCYGCGEIGHIKPRCPKGKSSKDKPGFKKQRAYISWGGDSGDESTDQEEEEAANLCLMAHEDQTDDIQE